MEFEASLVYRGSFRTAGLLIEILSQRGRRKGGGGGRERRRKKREKKKRKNKETKC